MDDDAGVRRSRRRRRASTYVHVRMLADPGYASFCDINADMSCTQVYESRYGSVFGVPVALGGVIWFAGVLLLT